MASNAGSSNRDHLGKRPKRDYDVEDTSSSNQQESTDRTTHSTNDHGRSSSQKEKLSELRTTMVKNKCSPPKNIPADMVSLLRRHSETNLIISKLHQDPVRTTVSAPYMIPTSSETNKSQQPPAPPYIPKWMPLMFRPPSNMSLSNTESEVATYIFMGSGIFDGKEILASSLHGKEIGDRQTLKTITPTSYLSSEVIMLVVSLLNNYKRLLCDYATCWFFPPEFSELVVKNKKSPADLSKEYRNPYMGYVDTIRKALTIEEMLMDRTFYELSSYQCPVISDFAYIELEGLSKILTSYNDCGVQVAKWMMYCTSNDDYQSIQVNAESRMRLALDLVLDRHNQLRDEIVKKAYHEFTKLTQGWDRILNYKI
ncbi:hypothetical protein SESBI_23117 [Sesbania bispinosa]|nr:hypothetical protein SESBI_23117 [Sesbania bispinosa]